MGYIAYERALLDKLRPMLPPNPRFEPLPLREWTWPVLKPYNGFTGEERIRGWQIGFWTRGMGLTVPAKTCDICAKTDRSVAYHSEDYYNTFASIPLCKGCHMAVHKRFANPAGWDAFVGHYAPYHPPGAWFTLLPAKEIDLAGHLRRQYGDSVTNLFDNPRYGFPDGTLMPSGNLYGVGPARQNTPPARARTRPVQPVANYELPLG